MLSTRGRRERSWEQVGDNLESFGFSFSDCSQSYPKTEYVRQGFSVSGSRSGVTQNTKVYNPRAELFDILFTVVCSLLNCLMIRVRKKKVKTQVSVLCYIASPEGNSPKKYHVTCMCERIKENFAFDH